MMRVIPTFLTPSGQNPARNLALCCLLAVGLGGCADGLADRDPLEPLNRDIHAFNLAVDKFALRPVASSTTGNGEVAARLSDFAGNLGKPADVVNNVLQLRLVKASENVLRFGVNTIFGLGGLFDVATAAGMPENDTDFGETLHVWGVGEGPYLEVPLSGPSTVRDTVAMPADWWGHPVDRMHPVSHRNSLLGLRLVDARANLLNATDTVDAAALDRYTLMRDFYLKQRDPASRQHNDDNAGRVESYDD